MAPSPNQVRQLLSHVCVCVCVCVLPPSLRRPFFAAVRFSDGRLSARAYPRVHSPALEQLRARGQFDAVCGRASNHSCGYDASAHTHRVRAAQEMQRDGRRVLGVGVWLGVVCTGCRGQPRVRLGGNGPLFPSLESRRGRTQSSSSRAQQHAPVGLSRKETPSSFGLPTCTSRMRRVLVWPNATGEKKQPYTSSRARA